MPLTKGLWVAIILFSGMRSFIGAAIYSPEAGKDVKKMRGKFNAFLLFFLLAALVVSSAGCGFFAQPGQTAAEVHRDHLRMLRVNQQELMYDLDRTFLLDEPSKLTNRKLP